MKGSHANAKAGQRLSNKVSDEITIYHHASYAPLIYHNNSDGDSDVMIDRCLCQYDTTIEE